MHAERLVPMEQPLVVGVEGEAGGARAARRPGTAGCRARRRGRRGSRRRAPPRARPRPSGRRRALRRGRRRATRSEGCGSRRASRGRTRRGRARSTPPSGRCARDSGRWRRRRSGQRWPGPPAARRAPRTSRCAAAPTRPSAGVASSTPSSAKPRRRARSTDWSLKRYRPGSGSSVIHWPTMLASWSRNQRMPSRAAMARWRASSGVCVPRRARSSATAFCGGSATSGRTAWSTRPAPRTSSTSTSSGAAARDAEREPVRARGGARLAQLGQLARGAVGIVQAGSQGICGRERS